MAAGIRRGLKDRLEYIRDLLHVPSFMAGQPLRAEQYGPLQHRSRACHRRPSAEADGTARTSRLPGRGQLPGHASAAVPS